MRLAVVLRNVLCFEDGEKDFIGLNQMDQQIRHAHRIRQKPKISCPSGTCSKRLRDESRILSENKARCSNSAVMSGVS
jgi:hypothetical protein